MCDTGKHHQNDLLETVNHHGFERGKNMVGLNDNNPTTYKENAN
jgi:hypothetical protein